MTSPAVTITGGLSNPAAWDCTQSVYSPLAPFTVRCTPLDATPWRCGSLQVGATANSASGIVRTSMYCDSSTVPAAQTRVVQGAGDTDQRVVPLDVALQGEIRCRVDEGGSASAVPSYNATCGATPAPPLGPQPCTGMVAVAAGSYHSLAIGPGGTVSAWGSNSAGQVGNGTTVATTTTASRVIGPNGTPITGVTNVAAGVFHSLAVGPGGTAYAWGNNAYGELGDGTTTRRYTATQVSGLTGVTDVAGAYRHSIATTASGTAYAWGLNTNGQLGDGTTTTRSTPAVVRAAGGAPLPNVIAVAAGNFHSLALDASGAVWAWGDNGMGQLGDGTTTSRITPAKVLGPNGLPLSGITDISTAYGHSVAVGTGGAVYAWGRNNDGQLGNGTYTGSLKAAPVLGANGSPLSGMVSATAGTAHSMAISAGGGAFAWGHNGYGQLGDGTYVYRLTAVPVIGPANAPFSGVTSLSAGYIHSIAVGPGGSLWSWGWNEFGQLGDGTFTTRNRPGGVLGCTP